MMSKNRQKWWISTNFQEKISLWWKSTKKHAFMPEKGAGKWWFSTIFLDFWKIGFFGGFPPFFRISEHEVQVHFWQKFLSPNGQNSAGFHRIQASNSVLIWDQSAAGRQHLDLKCCPKALKSAEKSPILKPSESSFSGKKQPKPAKNCRKILVLMFYAVKSWKLLQISHTKWWFVTFSFKQRLNSWKTGQNRLYSRKKLGSSSASLRKFLLVFWKCCLVLLKMCCPM